MYRLAKKFVPSDIRKMLKPFYLKWALRKFTNPAKVWIDRYQFFIWLNPNNRAVDEYIYIHKNWEPLISNIIFNSLNEGDVFIDIGANIGYFSLLGASIVGANGMVVAFEPLSSVSSQLRMSVDANDFENVEVRKMALGAEQSVSEIEIMPGNVGGSSLVKNIGSGLRESIFVSTLDEELKDVRCVNFIKIDVEGYEYEVLLGAKNIINKFKPTIILEFSPSVYRRQKVNNTSKILRLLIDLNYCIKDIDHGYPFLNVEQYLGLLGSKQTNLLLTQVHM